MYKIYGNHVAAQVNGMSQMGVLRPTKVLQPRMLVNWATSIPYFYLEWIFAYLLKLDTRLPLKIWDCSSFEVNILSHSFLWSNLSIKLALQRNQYGISKLGNLISSTVSTESTVQSSRVNMPLWLVHLCMDLKLIIRIWRVIH